jgi:hypothetical protein
MSAIIYEKTANGLYPTGQRTVATFPSGLIRVEQNFVCKTSAESTHRDALAVGEDFPNGSDPSFDGLKIFPESQEVRRGDGFTEFKVTAYGRKNTAGTFSFLNDSFFTKFTLDGDRLMRTKPILVKRVFVSSAGYDTEDDFSNLSNPTLYFANQTLPSGTTFKDYPGAPEIQNYGYFSEVTVRITRM